MVLIVRKTLGMLLATTVLLAGTASGQTIRPGEGEQSVTLPKATLSLFTYRPASCSANLLLLVFHGVNRDAGPYRDRARPLADRLFAIVVAPLFDKERFPRDLYQYGGIVRNGVVAEPGNRTGDLVHPLVAWARAAIGALQLPYVLLGHSAGAQFVDRVAAFTATDAARIVVANPSTWVMPSLVDAAPFGFGGLAPPAAEKALQAYLARPLVVLLGEADTGTRHLASSPEAMAQGYYRLARGRNAFRAATQVVQQRHWTIGWTLIEVPGVAHDAAAMFSAPQAAAALANLRLRRP